MMSPAEQAWLSQGATAARRGMLFSTNAALAFLGMAAGSVLTGLLPSVQSFLPGLLAYRAYFLLVGIGAVVNSVLLLNAKDLSRTDPGGDTVDLQIDRRVKKADSACRDSPSAGERGVRRTENLFIAKLAFINGLNGIAIGLTSPLLVYWFKLRFGAGPAAIGPVFALTFLLTAASSLWTGKLTERFGIVRAVVVVRLAAVGMLVLMPLMPTFALAAIVHVLRSALGRGSIGARQALAMNLVRDSRRGFASSINSISMTLPQSVSPSIAGLLLEAGRLNLPFLLAAVLQLLFVTLYGVTFRRYDNAPAARGDPEIR
jgi:MFS family permease